MAHSSPLKKATAAIVSFLIFGNAVLVEAAQATLWSERQAAVRAPSAETPETAAPAAPEKPLTPLEKVLLALRPDLGAVRSVKRAAGAEKGVVVAINDIHGNAEAQENIRRAVEALSSAGLVRLGLEGTAEAIDIAPLRAGIDREDLGKISRYLSGRDDISGAAAAALAGPADVTAFGIDDAGLHRANADAYLRSRGRGPRLAASLDRLNRSLTDQKRRLFSKALAETDGIIGGYHAGAVPLGVYLTHVSARAGSGSANLRTFLNALKLEKSLDLPAVENDRRRVLERVASKADRDQLTRLLDQTAAFRTGRIGSGAYYEFVRTLCDQAGVPLARFPAMDAYVRYVALADRVDAGALLTEGAELERRACARLASTPEQKALVNASRWAMLARKIQDFSLTREEWAEYAILPRPAGAPDAETLEPFETFYRMAEARDAALAANANRLLAGAGGIVVAGGFHGDALRRHLGDSGWTVVEFSPRVSHADGGSGYLSVFAREKTPLEKLFAGEKLFLKNDPFPAAVRQGLIPSAALGLRALRGTTGGELPFMKKAAPETPIDDARVAVTGRDTAEVTVSRPNGDVQVLVADGGKDLATLSQKAVPRNTLSRLGAALRFGSWAALAVVLSASVAALLLQGSGFAARPSLGILFAVIVAASMMLGVVGVDEATSPATPDDRPRYLADGRVFHAEGEGVPLPSRLELSPSALGERTDDVARRVLDVVARRQLHDIATMGRSLVINLPEGEHITVDGRTYSRIVMKRTTYRGALPEAREYVPSAEDLMVQPNIAVHSAPDGRAWWEPIPERVVGTGPVTDNVAEYRMMLAARRANVPVPRPIGVGEYTNLSFGGRTLGFLVYLDNGGERIGEAFRTRRAALAAAESRDAADAVIRSLVTDIIPNVVAAARALRRLHDAGITHSHPHLSQFTLARDGVATLYDFDNARTAEGMSREEFEYACLRDFAYLYGSVDNILLGDMPQSTKRLIYGTMLPMLGVQDPFEAVMEGYFRPDERDPMFPYHFRTDFPLLNVRLRVPEGGGRFSDIDPEFRAYFERIAGPVHDDILREALRHQFPADEVESLLPALAAVHRIALEAGAVSPAAAAAALPPGMDSTRIATLTGLANELTGHRNPSRTPVLILPFVKFLSALAYKAYRAFRGNPVNIARAMIVVEIAAMKSWYRTRVVPLIELPALPGFALTVLWVLPGMSLFIAVPIAAVLGGIIFALLHGLPGATNGQSWSEFAMRSGATIGINLVALIVFSGLDGGAGLAAAFASSYVLHGSWNAFLPSHWELTFSGWGGFLRALLGQMTAAFAPKPVPPSEAQRLASRVAEAAVLLHGETIDRAAVAARVTAIADDFPVALGVESIAGRSAAVVGKTPFVDESEYAAALAAEYAARGLSTSVDAVRADLQSLILSGASTREVAVALARTDAGETTMGETQGNIAILSPTLKVAEENQLIDLLLRRSTLMRSRAVFVAADAAQFERISKNTNGRAVVLLGRGVLGDRDGQGTVEMAALLSQLTDAGIRMDGFAAVRFIAPSARIVVMDGVPVDLPWIRRAALILIDDTLRSIEATMPALQDIERIALLVSRQA